MRRTGFIACMLLLCALALSACGGGGGGTAAPAGGAKAVTVNMGENNKLIFTPATLSMAKGETLNATVVNKDTVQPHSFVITELNVKTTQMAANKTESVAIKAPTAGTYTYFCDVPGHKDAGMIGKLEVK